MESTSDRLGILRTALSLVALVSLATGVVMVVRPFIEPLLWAGIIALASWPLFRRVKRILPRHPNVSALMMTSLVAILLVGIITPGVAALVAELRSSVSSVQRVLSEGNGWEGIELQSLPVIGPYLPDLSESMGDLKSEALAYVRDHQQEIVGLVGTVARGTITFLITLLVTLFSLFFIYRWGDTLAQQTRQALAIIGSARSDHLLDAVRDTVKGTVYGVGLTAVAQGILAGIGFMVAGAPFPVLLGFITVIISFVPFGPPLIYLPVAGVLLVQGAPWFVAIGLAAYGVLIVSTADNILRPLFISQATNLSVLLVLIGVVGGILAFGLVGLFIGPLLIAVAVTLWREWLEAHRERVPL